MMAISCFSCYKWVIGTLILIVLFWYLMYVLTKQINRIRKRKNARLKN